MSLAFLIKIADGEGGDVLVVVVGTDKMMLAQGLVRFGGLVPEGELSLSYSVRR